MSAPAPIDHAPPEFVPGAASPAVGVRYAWFVILLLTLANTLNYVDRSIVSILAEDIKHDFGLTDAQIGFLYGTAFAVFFAVFGIPAGMLADSRARTRLLGGALVLWSGLTALSGLAANFAQLALVRLGVGIGEATGAPCSQSLVTDYFPRQTRGRAMAIYLAGSSLGVGASLLVGGAVAQAWDQHCPAHYCFIHGWRLAYLVVGAPGLVVAVLLMLAREPPRGGLDGRPVPARSTPLRHVILETFFAVPPLTIIRQLAARQWRGAAAASLLFLVVAAAAATLGALTHDWAQWLSLGVGILAIGFWNQSLARHNPTAFRATWGSRAFVMLVIGTSLLGCMQQAASFWAAPHAIRSFGLTKGEAGLTYGGLLAAGGLSGAVIGGAILDRWRRSDERAPVLFALVCLFCQAPAVALMLTAHGPVQHLVGFACIALLTGSWPPGVAIMVQELAPPGVRGVAAASFNLSAILIMLATGPYIAGKVSTLTGSLTIGIAAPYVLMPLAATFMWLAARAVPEGLRRAAIAT